MARNNLNVVKISARQDEISIEEEVIMTVSDFNIQQQLIAVLVNIDITEKELDNLNIYKGEIKLIPTETDLSRTKLNMPTGGDVGALIRGATVRPPKEVEKLMSLWSQLNQLRQADEDFLSKFYGNRPQPTYDNNPLSAGNLIWWR